MARQTKSTHRRTQAETEGLVHHYRAIGPAAILAALLYTQRSRIIFPAPARKAA